MFYLLAGHEPMARSLRSPDERTILPLACLAAVYFALNSGLTAVAVALSKGASPWRFWREHFAVMSVNYFAAASAAFFLILLVRHVGAGALAAVVPLLIVCHLAMRSWLGRVDDAQKHLQRRQPALPVDDLGLLDRDRGQGRRHQRSHPPRAGLRDGPGAGAGGDRSSRR